MFMSSGFISRGCSWLRVTPADEQFRPLMSGDGYEPAVRDADLLTGRLASRRTPWRMGLTICCGCPPSCVVDDAVLEVEIVEGHSSDATKGLERILAS